MSNKVPGIIFAAWFLTFVIFFVVSFHSGAAINGKLAGGHYYLGQHGSYTEVSHSWFLFSAFLTAVLGLGLPLFACPMIWSELRKKNQPVYHPIGLFGALMSVVVGGGFCYGSIRCILGI